jgi:hypothetical protein
MLFARCGRMAHDLSWVCMIMCMFYGTVCASIHLCACVADVQTSAPMELYSRLYAHVCVRRIQRTCVAHDARSHTYNRERDHIHPMRICVLSTRSNTARRSAEAHEEIALGRVRFGAPLTAVLPYGCAAEWVSIFARIGVSKFGWSRLELGLRLGL